MMLPGFAKIEFDGKELVVRIPIELDLKVSGALRRLSRREREIYEIMHGKTNKEIARALGITERTVAFHVGAILQKFGVSSRNQL